MVSPIWDDFLTDRDKLVLQHSGYATQAGFGARPALLVVDATYDFVGDKPEPILEAITRWPNASGEAAWAAVAAIGTLAAAARAKGVPVIYTLSGVRADGWDLGGWRWKNARADEWRARPDGPDGNAIVAEIAPAAQDIVIPKHKASAFFGTPLIGHLTQLQADSVIVTGGTTSGCVRASVVDAFSYNFKVVVAEDACFDRLEASHAVNLCDMNAKYADVLPAAVVEAYLDGLPDGLFVLPAAASLAVGLE